MNTIQLALSAVALASFVACAVDDTVETADEVDVDVDVDPAADGLVIDADVVVAGVVVRFVNEGAAAFDLDGCVDAGRCSVRFGDIAADIANATVTPSEVIAVVPAGVERGPACLTLDDVERCVAVDVVAAPVVVEVTSRTETCACRCIAPTYTVLEVRGAALPADAVIEVDGVVVGGWVDDSETLTASVSSALSPGTHTLTVRAPSHGDAASEAFAFVVVDD